MLYQRLAVSPIRLRLRGWMRSPLLHFVLIGASLFLLYYLVSPPRLVAPGSRIVLTDDDLRQIDYGWIAKWRRPPTPAERRDLVNEKIREEVLYREAVAMGLDQDDAIVRRRLGQKLEFLIEDVSAIRDPTQAELESWFAHNARRFMVSGHATFCQIYFSPDVRGLRAEGDASRVLGSLKSGITCNSSMSLGDRFPDQSYYAERTPEDVANIFGTQFAQSLFRLKPGTWQGPVESGLGWHLVLVDTLTPARIPEFGEVDRAKVISAWLDSQRDESKRKAYDAMRAKYEVVLPSAAGS
jgi:peptidyl-prolyl cis-trans isomerase C